MEPVEYARLLRRRWRVVAASVLVVALSAWLTTPATPAAPVVDWRATHVLVRAEDPNPRAIATVGLLATTGEVPRRVAEQIGFDGQPAVLARRISVVPNEAVGTLSIVATARSPEAAADLANQWAAQTLAYLGEQDGEEIAASLVAAEERVNTLRADIDALSATIADDGPDVDLVQAERDAKLRQFGAAFEALEQLQRAPAPKAGFATLEPAIPELAAASNAGFGAPRGRTTRGVIAALLGLLLGIALVLVLERVDPRLRTRSAAEDAFGLPVLASVPHVSRKQRAGILSLNHPGSVASEAYRSVRSGILLMGLHVLTEPSAPGAVVERPTGESGQGAGEPSVILITSPAPGEGKSTTVANLAVAFAETGRSVLVLACDFRRPEVHLAFGVPAEPGLTDVFAGGPGAPRLREVVQPTKVTGVSIITNGAPLHSFGDLAANGRALVTEARGMADVVLIDTPPVLVTNDAVELIPVVDSVVLVARSGKTTKDAAVRAKELIARLRAPVAGVVLIGAPTEGGQYGGYYNAYGGKLQALPATLAVPPGAKPVDPGRLPGVDDRTVVVRQRTWEPAEKRASG